MIEIELLNTTNKTRDGLYEIHVGNFDENVLYKFYSFILEEKHEGRPWLISNDLYQDTNQIDILCDINSIYNPLMFIKGQIVFYPEKNDLTSIRQAQNSNAISDIVKDFIKSANVGKEQKKDTNRSADKAKEAEIEKQKKFIPPNIIKINDGNIQYGDGSIILLPNF